jgi:hypothetical protein
VITGSIRGGVLASWGDWENPVDLQEKGKAGWELVSVHTISSNSQVAGATDTVCYTFKRPIEQTG